MGSFNFGGNRWVNSSASASTATSMGQDMAQFVYGLPSQGFYDIDTYGSWHSYSVSGLVQDDWRVSHNITFNPFAYHVRNDGKQYFQLRGEIFSALNHPQFSFPNLAPTNSAFGLITSQSNGSRQAQLALKFLW